VLPHIFFEAGFYHETKTSTTTTRNELTKKACLMNIDAKNA
jgi:hypothetical protein